MFPVSRSKSSAPLLAVAFVFTLLVASDCAAQSSDPAFPAPVFSNEVSGSIAPRDIGDARRTRHFYTFRGTEGDLLVKLESAELVGDVDVFNANGMRPLIKFTLFGDATNVSKSFYLRKEETLVLRVEARAAGDADGTYRITFGGSFAPAPTELANAPQPAEPTVSSAERSGKNVRRVTSTGARIEEPAPTPAEVASEPEATPTPAPEVERKPAPRRGRGSRTSPNRTRGSSSRTKPATTDTAKSETTDTAQSSETAESKPDANTEKPTEATPEPEKPATPAPKRTPAPRRRGARGTGRSARNESARTTAPDSSAQPSADAQPSTQPAPSQRLVVVTKDGETIERDMNTVRRVTVENNQLVVVTRDGKVIRQPMANVLRMSIEP